MRRLRPTWFLLLIAALGACRRDSRTKPNEEAAMSAPNAVRPDPPDAAIAQAVDREMTITDLDASAKLRVKVPAAWSASEGSVVLRNEYKEAIVGVQFTIICNKDCGGEEIARLSQIVDQTFETRARPNVNTGDPAMDAVRMKIEPVAEGDVPDGKFRVARVTKPADVHGPYREELYAVCVRAKRGAKVVAAQAWVTLDRQKDLGPVIVNACKTFEIL
jgi:hypothetical protein